MPAFVVPHGALAQVVDYVLSAAYLLLVLAAACALAFVLLRRGWTKWITGFDVVEYTTSWTVLVSYMLLLALQALVRALFFLWIGVSSSVDAQPTLLPDPVRIMWAQFPITLYFSCYTFVVVWWALLYHRSRTVRRWIVRACLVANLFVYFVYAVCYSLYFVPDIPDDFTFDASSVFLSLVSISFAVSFIVYGSLLLYRFRSSKFENAFMSRTDVWSLLVGMIVSSTCFLLRGLSLLLSIALYYLDLSIYNEYTMWLYLAFYFGVCELFPSFLMLAIVFRTLQIPSRRGVSDTSWFSVSSSKTSLRTLPGTGSVGETSLTYGSSPRYEPAVALERGGPVFPRFSAASTIGGGGGGGGGGRSVALTGSLGRDFDWPSSSDGSTDVSTPVVPAVPSPSRPKQPKLLT
jgi:hypothetical protein